MSREELDGGELRLFRQCDGETTAAKVGVNCAFLPTNVVSGRVRRGGRSLNSLQEDRQVNAFQYRDARSQRREIPRSVGSERGEPGWAFHDPLSCPGRRVERPDIGDLGGMANPPRARFSALLRRHRVFFRKRPRPEPLRRGQSRLCRLCLCLCRCNDVDRLRRPFRTGRLRDSRGGFRDSSRISTG